jgi:hypothetical protein
MPDAASLGIEQLADELTEITGCDSLDLHH